MGTRILVTGSRDWTDFAAIVEALRAWKAPGAVLVHGGARGADRMAAAIWRGWGLTVEDHYADWDQHGRSAGYLRNQQMIAAGADVCLAFILNGSRGATHCANSAETAGIPTRRYQRNSPHHEANHEAYRGLEARPNRRTVAQQPLWSEELR